ncbi:hypothetical protein, partial [Candidatus Aquicultor secundus]|uniref:hypothetical protein n=1 Tax=Candidatus Aquicultor secundus TaxID=1973895 RepID=UPI00257B869E
MPQRVPIQAARSSLKLSQKDAPNIPNISKNKGQRIGIGGGFRRRPSHTTVQAGPHTAVRQNE